MNRIILIATFLFSLSLYAQKGSFTSTEKHIESKVSRSEMENTKGWKHEHRWLDEFKKRSNPSGNFYKGSEVYPEMERAASQKLQQNRSRTSGWIPVGPDTRADNTLTKGLGRINCITFHPTDPNTFWVGVAQGGVWKTTNSGTSWTPLTDELPIIRISDIAIDPNHPDTMYVCLGDYAYIDVSLSLDDRDRHSHYGIGVYKTTDGGTTWNPTGLTYQMEQLDESLTRRVFVDPNNSSHLLAAGADGIWSSIDGGDNWSQEVDSLIWDIEADPNDPNTIYASTGYLGDSQTGLAGIMKSTDFGDNWTWLNTGIPETGTVQRVELAIAPSNSAHVYALCSNMEGGFYGLYSSIDGGSNWTMSTAGGKNILEWYEGGGAGGQGTYDLAIMVHPTNENVIYTGGVNVWSSNDGGQNFDGVSLWYSSLHADQHQFKYNPLDGMYYVCNDGGLMRTDTIIMGSWSTETWPTVWEYVSDGMQTNSFYRIGLSEGNSGNFSAGAQDNSTYFNNGGSWSNLFGGDGMETMLHPTNADIIYGSYQYGSIAYSNNGGLSSNSMNGPWSEDGEWTTPYMYHPGSTDIVYGGFGNIHVTTPGNNFNNPISNFSDMIGATVPAPVSHFNISQSDPNYIYVAKRIYHSYNQPSEMWMTPDGGSTWSNISAGLPDSIYFNYIDIDNDDPLSAWVVVAGYESDQHVFHTIDGGANWDNVTYDLPNLPTNCIVHHDSSLFNMVYVGTDIGVYYTNDTLQSWLPLNDNLPNVIVSELDIHYTDQKIYAATFGRGVWMTDLLTTEMVMPDTTTIDTTTIDTTGTGTAIEEMLNRSEINLFPNPNNGEFDVIIDGYSGKVLNMEVVNVMGRIVASDRLLINGSSYKETFQYELVSGVYFLKISSGNRMRTIKFLVE